MSITNPPRIRRTGANIQFTHNLPRRVNDVQTYPVQSPQGAAILIYGHENGVTVVWRGGKRFKPAKEASKEKQNGSNDDAVMIIDSDDEQPPTKPHSAANFVDKPEFEDEVEEGPYPEIIQTLDLTLGTAVSKVAVLPITPCPADQAAVGGATILTEKMVFAVSCVTNDIYVVTLPLTPPSLESKARPELRRDLLAGKAGSGAWGESLILLGGQSKQSQGIAMTLATSGTSKQIGKVPHAVVAAHSREASGVLRLWDVPLEQTTGSGGRIEPLQTEFLPWPLTSISFNPTHTSQLLASTSTQGVRIYDFATAAIPTDTDASTAFPPQGSWLLSLYQPFTRSSTRIPMVDAAWIAHGRAVFALLADGSWGIWDVDGLGPSSSGTLLSQKLKCGIRGSALTAFSVSGFVEGVNSLRSTAPQSQESRSAQFAPMTPFTRRQAAASLGSTLGSTQLAGIRGGIKVLAPLSSGKALQDETVVLWIGGLDHVCVIRGILRFWESQQRLVSGKSGNVFSATQPTRMSRLSDLSVGLLGERCCGVGLVMDHTSPGDNGQRESASPISVLIQGESRIVVVREDKDGPGMLIGGVVGRRRRLFSGEMSNAIIVHGKVDTAPKMNFNLSTVKPGTLRKKPLLFAQEEDNQDVTGMEATQLLSQTRGGFSFADTMNAAADVSDDRTRRDVEAEMLDIMEIDQALENLAGDRGTNGTRRVFFEEN
ncbi:hypothetical protein B0I35DRAFT_350276 [Stachybotrys elegans]|uniref:Nucleoporin NUP37 n=1 Tax=Stachybotrys elegans TaxID=80388 RepID=A0A8K0WTG0_9HYPO|nr:hypothetical protein B0I35DRAFT_350276 [Stachybotrys elegans]